MAAAERRGGPHAIVSNAAIQYERTIEDTPPEDWDRVLGINLKGVYLCARAAIPRMRRLGGGSIVNMASVNGFWVEPQLGAYCTAKGGVINLTRAIALDFGKDGIRCNCICPGYIDTGMAQRYFEVQPDPEAARVEAGRLHALRRASAARRRSRRWRCSCARTSPRSARRSRSSSTAGCPPACRPADLGAASWQVGRELADAGARASPPGGPSRAPGARRRLQVQRRWDRRAAALRSPNLTCTGAATRTMSGTR